MAAGGIGLAVARWAAPRAGSLRERAAGTAALAAKSYAISAAYVAALIFGAGGGDFSTSWVTPPQAAVAALAITVPVELILLALRAGFRPPIIGPLGLIGLLICVAYYIAILTSPVLILMAIYWLAEQAAAAFPFLTRDAVLYVAVLFPLGQLLYAAGAFALSVMGSRAEVRE